ncbi:hypothetical protein BB560_003280 [Smittium megazygosporum]|uniref:Uncharacterized protein n=1 Tax=Smittium megazygosporum TaxID=133381 RepID=A0A2T9ZCI2_9FUNG|nr:hypothetical protein BB560_003280 [Smittium megazygosporum]
MALAIFSQFVSVTFTVISFFGAVCLSLLGYCYKIKVKELTDSVHDPKDPEAVGNACYSAALIYLGLFFFCGCQVMANKFKSRNAISL